MEKEYRKLTEEQIKEYKTEFQITKECKQDLEMGDDMEF